MGLNIILCIWANSALIAGLAVLTDVIEAWRL